ncbi:unnamed protein product [Durusdinium trenchii]|uniref:Uncharacterized protein n=1 Tax=Durusdinium trenchii TaxID=1381693 RepID=A0ABP0QA10_9DINO
MALELPTSLRTPPSCAPRTWTTRAPLRTARTGASTWNRRPLHLALALVPWAFRRGTRRHVVRLWASFGPTPMAEEQKQDIRSTQIGSRVSYVVLSNMQPILRQLDQYGYSQVDGFLGDANGYPEQIRAEMKSLFDKGFFEEEPESDAQFKVGPYRITNQDREHRFRYRIKGRSGEERMEQLIQNQYEIAPTVVNFARSLLVSFARPLGELTESGLSNTKGISELFVLCGQGARYDRRVSNVYGWQTEQGFVRDPRKLVAIYFSNPNYREELGGVLQLEGVITPTGAVRISPVADRLVLFWADKTVWSMTPSRSSMISEHQWLGRRGASLLTSPSELDHPRAPWSFLAYHSK